jgi:protein-tyrosine phosphatase
MKRADLHFHLLPDVDDGPADLAGALDLAAAALADGADTVVATPHVRTDLGLTNPREVHERVRALRVALARAGLDLEVRCGGELGHDMVARLRQDELQLLAQGPPWARWLLVETPFEGVGSDFHAATAELRARGFGVVVAHPERSADASLDGAAGLRRELSDGSLAQVNALSLTGDHGDEACAAAWELVAEGLVAVVASDAHGPTRPPALTAARHALVGGGVSRANADALTSAAPCRLLAHGIGPQPAAMAA